MYEASNDHQSRSGSSGSSSGQPDLLVNHYHTPMYPTIIITCQVGTEFRK